MSELSCQKRLDKHCGERKWYVTLYFIKVNKEKTLGTFVLKG